MVVAHGTEGGGVDGAVPQKFVCRTVELTGAGVGDDVDLTASGTTHVRGVAAGLYLKFLDGVRRRAEILRVEGWVGVGRAIEQKEVGVGPRAANHHSGTLARPPIERIRFA